MNYIYHISIYWNTGPIPAPADPWLPPAKSYWETPDVLTMPALSIFLLTLLEGNPSYAWNLPSQIKTLAAWLIGQSKTLDYFTMDDWGMLSDNVTGERNRLKITIPWKSSKFIGPTILLDVSRVPSTSLSKEVLRGRQTSSVVSDDVNRKGTKEGS